MTKLLDVLSPTASSIKSAYAKSVSIRDSAKTKAELKTTASSMAQEFTVIGGMLDALRHMADRVDADTEKRLIDNIKILQEIVTNAANVLNKVTSNQGFFQSLFKTKESYQKELLTIQEYLNQTCLIIQRYMTPIHKISIPCKEFADFRRIFRETSEKQVSIYDFSIIRDTPNSVATLSIEDFDPTSPCYIKLSEEHVVFSHRFRTWTSPIPKAVILEQRRANFRLKLWSSNPSTSSSTLTNSSHTSTLSSATLASLPQTSSNQCLNFTEFTLSHDDISGMTLTKKLIYVATKYDISVMELSTRNVIAVYGSDEKNKDRFQDITYLYIPSDNEQMLYVVDNGQHMVFQYEINDTGDCLKLLYKYVVVADVNETPNLIACAVFNGKLFVSDDANNCLHIFDLCNSRQVLYVRGNSMTPFTPGTMCACNNYLYVANCSLESPSILVFDKECNPVDWLRNKVFEQILAIDIWPTINELFILTTNTFQSGGIKRPLVITMDLAKPL